MTQDGGHESYFALEGPLHLDLCPYDQAASQKICF